MTAEVHGGARRLSRSVWLGIVIVVLLIVTGSGWAWWSTRDHELSVKPPHSANSQPLPSTPSSVQATATLPVAVITDAINKAVPASFRLAGRQKVCAQLTEQIKKTVQKAVGGDVGKFLGEVTKFVTEVITVNQTREVCQDVDYHVDISRNGAIDVAGAGDHVRISVPISATGQAGFTGDVAKALALDKKNFRGALNAFADIRLDLGRDWCPNLALSADFNWTNKAEFEIVHKWWINIDGQVGPKLKELIQDAVADLRKKLTCDDVKKAVKPHWRPYSFPISVPGSSEPLAFVNLIPLTIGFSGVQYQTEALSIALGIEANTEVATTSAAVKEKGFELPPLERIPVMANQLNITIPVRVGYDAAVAAWSVLLKDKTFTATTPAGDVKLTIDKIALYPSVGQLAFAMHFTAKIGSRILDTSGWVYLVADPALDTANQILRVKNVTFTRELDNDLWSVLSAVFSSQIKQFIEERAAYDLKPDIAKLRAQLNAQLAEMKKTQKVAVDLRTGFVGLKQVNVAQQALEIALALEGTADITIDSLMPAN